jgi:hypothetical protein
MTMTTTEQLKMAKADESTEVFHFIFWRNSHSSLLAARDYPKAIVRCRCFRSTRHQNTTKNRRAEKVENRRPRVE